MSVEPTAGSVLKDCIPLVNNILEEEEEADKIKKQLEAAGAKIELK